SSRRGCGASACSRTCHRTTQRRRPIGAFTEGQHVRFDYPGRPLIIPVIANMLRSWWLSVRVSFYALPAQLDVVVPHHANPGNFDKNAERRVMKNHDQESVWRTIACHICN